jgi:hypothetical protein
MHAEYREPTKEEWSNTKIDNPAKFGRFLAEKLWWQAYDQQKLILSKEKLQNLIYEFLEYDDFFGQTYNMLEAYVEKNGLKPDYECEGCEEAAENHFYVPPVHAQCIPGGEQITGQLPSLPPGLATKEDSK